jgi:hypothetical protein
MQMQMQQQQLNGVNGGMFDDMLGGSYQTPPMMPPMMFHVNNVNVNANGELLPQQPPLIMMNGAHQQQQQQLQMLNQHQQLPHLSADQFRAHDDESLQIEEQLALATKMLAISGDAAAAINNVVANTGGVGDSVGVGGGVGVGVGVGGGVGGLGVADSLLFSGTLGGSISDDAALGPPSPAI